MILPLCTQSPLRTQTHMTLGTCARPCALRIRDRRSVLRVTAQEQIAPHRTCRQGLSTSTATTSTIARAIVAARLRAYTANPPATNAPRRAAGRDKSRSRLRGNRLLCCLFFSPFSFLVHKFSFVLRKQRRMQHLYHSAYATNTNTAHSHLVTRQRDCKKK